MAEDSTLYRLETRFRDSADISIDGEPYVALAAVEPSELAQMQIDALAWAAEVVKSYASVGGHASVLHVLAEFDEMMDALRSGDPMIKNESDHDRAERESGGTG